MTESCDLVITNKRNQNQAKKGIKLEKKKSR